jgi:site-specific DNA recombinase
VKRAAAYARYSTDKQYDTSIEKQLEDIKAYCERKNYVVVKTYIDRAESAAKEDRPSFRQMLQDAKKHLFDVIVVHKLNRLARDRYLSVVTAHELKKYGVEIESALEPIGSDPVGQLLWGILDAVNEFERLNTIQEVKMKMRPLAEKGYWLGGRIPFGFKGVKVKDEAGKTHTKLEVNEAEASIVREMFYLFARGFSFKKIARILNEKGFTNRGKEWTFSAVSEIIKNPRYVGMHFWGKGTKRNHRIVRKDAIFVEGPAIVDKETWEKVQERLKKYVKGRERRYNYIFTGIAFCECGASLHGSFQKIPVYVCKHYKVNAQNHVQISAKRLEGYVRGYLQKILNPENIDFERLAKSINEYFEESTLSFDEIERFLEERKECEEAISNLTTALAKTPPVAQQKILDEIEKYSCRLTEIDETLREASKDKKKVTAEELRELYSKLFSALNENFEEVVKRMIKRITVYKSGYIDIRSEFQM